ncbi:MAG: FlgD immunoglobulin-like domain containing protein, partial [bacterium]
YLYPPGGGAVVVSSSAGDRVDFQLTSTGTHTIVIEDNANNDAGGYSMSFLNVTAGPLTNGSDTDGGAILSNQIKAGQFNQGVDFDAYTFSGTNGQRIIIAGVATGAGAHNTKIAVYPPGGGAAIISSVVDRYDVQLTSTGTHTFVIEENGNNDAGTYTLSFVNVTAGPYTDGGDPDGGAIVSNEIKSGTTSGSSDIDAFTFSGTSGQRVLLSAKTTSGALDTWIYLYPPGGGAVVVSSSAGDRVDFQLTSTGTHVIVIEDNANNDAGGYTMSFLNVTAGPYTGGAETDGGAIVSGVAEMGSAISAADFDGYTFSATSGDTAIISCIATIGPMNTQIAVYPPAGGAALISTTVDSFNQTLPLTGTYTIVVEDNAQDQTGNYTLTLNGINGGGATDVPTGGTEPLDFSRAALLPASPSPFLNSTRLDFRVAQEGPVQLRIYDVTGSLVRALVDETLRPGAHPAVWDGNDDRGSRVASGIYYAQLQTGGEVKKQKVVRIR